MTSEDILARLLREEAEAKEQQKVTVAIGVLMVIAMLGGFWWWSGVISESNYQQSRSPDMGSPTKAWVDAQFKVRSMLKTPSTATFPGYNPDFVTELGGGRFRVSGYVDAQNSFGAMRRTNFSCDLVYGVGNGQVGCSLSR